MKYRILIAVLLAGWAASANAQTCVDTTCGLGWVFASQNPVIVFAPPIGTGNGYALIQFNQTESDANRFFTNYQVSGQNPNDFLINGTQNGFSPVCGFADINPGPICYLGLYFTASIIGEETATLTFSGLGGTISFDVIGNPSVNLNGKWVLWESAGTASQGHSCFGQLDNSCYEIYFDLAQDQNNNLSSPANPLDSGTTLALDNSNCGGGTPAVTGSLVQNKVSLDITENILYGAPGGVFGFVGNYLPNQNYTGFNLDGSSAPFHGQANQITGTNQGSSGCPTQDTGIGFAAYQYPSLDTADITVDVISQPGVLNLPVSINIELQENPDFSVSATGTLTGPSCGPLTFTSVDGQAVGNLYGIDADYTNRAGGTGTLSIGLSLVTPFVVSQAALQSAGYTASGPGYPLQVWSVDWTASSDGSCTADPITIGYGVATPKYHKHHEHHRHRNFDWNNFWKHHAQIRKASWVTR